MSLAYCKKKVKNVKNWQREKMNLGRIDSKCVGYFKKLQHKNILDRKDKLF
jgi:hypothetical protein